MPGWIFCPRSFDKIGGDSFGILVAVTPSFSRFLFNRYGFLSRILGLRIHLRYDAENARVKKKKRKKGYAMKMIPYVFHDLFSRHRFNY